jgi:hypothetical protein
MIDVYSRYAWVFPIKKKSPKEIAPHVKSVYESLKKRPLLTFTSDEGKEFLGDVSKVLKEYNVKKYTTASDDFQSKYKTSVIERFNRTIQDLLKRYMISNDTLTYIDALPELVENYNNSYHSTIGNTPYHIFKHPGDKPIFIDLTEISKKDFEKTNQSDKFEIGDWVRHQKQRKTFDKKGFVENFSIKSYQIKEKKGKKYLLSNNKYYFERNLIKSNESNQTSKLKPALKQATKEKRFEKEKKNEVTIEDITKQN